MQTDPSKPDPPRRKRRWLQFSLRSALIFTLICAVGSAWVARRIEQKRREREAVAAVYKSGGFAYYDYQYDGALAKPPGPDWLRGLAGENFFSDVMLLYWSGNDGKPIDADLKTCELFVQLRDLQLGETAVTDAGLAHVKGFLQLRRLLLADTNITDSGMVHLKDLANLKILELDRTKITDLGLENLEGMTELKNLSLEGTNITDAGLVHLRGLRRLEELSLWNTNVTDAGLTHLSGLRQLKSLTLRGTKVTDAGLKHLKGLFRLQDLMLQDSKVFNDAAVNDLQKALPKCSVYLGFGFWPIDRPASSRPAK